MLEDLRKRLSSEQIRLLTLVWSHYLTKGKWVPRKIVHHAFQPNGRGVVGEAMRALGGSIVYEGWEEGEVYRVTLLGAVLSERGREIEELLVKYLAFAGRIFDETPDRGRVLSAEVQEALGLFDADTELLGRLIFFDGFLGAGGGSGQGWWQTDLPHGVEDIANDAREWLQAKLLATYRPGMATASPDRERQMFDRSELKPVVEYDRGAVGRLPAPLIADVAASVSFAYTHSKIDNVFRRSGARGDPPVGTNKLDKVTIWLGRADADPSVDVYAVLGGVLHEFMESESFHGEFGAAVRTERERVNRALAKHGLSYGAGGRIFGGAVSLPTKSLDALIRQRNVPEIEKEFQRALENVEARPRGGRHRRVRDRRVHLQDLHRRGAADAAGRPVHPAALAGRAGPSRPRPVQAVGHGAAADARRPGLGRPRRRRAQDPPGLRPRARPGRERDRVAPREAGRPRGPLVGRVRPRELEAQVTEAQSRRGPGARQRCPPRAANVCDGCGERAAGRHWRDGLLL